MAYMASDCSEQSTFPHDGDACSMSKASQVSLLSNNQTPSFDLCLSQSKTRSPKVDVLVAGSLAIDLSCDYVPITQRGSAKCVQTPVSRTSNPAMISQSLGGVGQNLATGLFYLGTSVSLCSAVGDDTVGKTAIAILNERGMQTDNIEVMKDGSRSAQYVAFNDLHKDLVIAMADMSILDKGSSDFLTKWKPHLDRCQPEWLVLDANWDADTLQEWMFAARASRMKVAYEPVSREKSGRIFGSDVTGKRLHIPLVDLATPNESELEAMWAFARLQAKYSSLWRGDRFQVQTSELNLNPIDQSIMHKALDLLPLIPCILTTLGSKGILMTELLYAGDPRLNNSQDSQYVFRVDKVRFSDRIGTVAGAYVKHFPPVEKVSQDQVVSVNGVGDTFLGIIVAGLAKEDPKTIGELIDIAQRGAVMTLKSRESVSPEIATLTCML